MTTLPAPLLGFQKHFKYFALVSSHMSGKESEDVSRFGVWERVTYCVYIANPLSPLEAFIRQILTDC